MNTIIRRCISFSIITNSEPTNSSNQPNKTQQPKSKESGKQVNWSQQTVIGNRTSL